MRKSFKIIFVALLAFSFVLPHGIASSGIAQLRDETLNYYKNNKTAIESFWEAGAIYGAGAELSSDIWNFESLNSGELNKGSNPTEYANYILADLALGKDPRTLISGRNIVKELSYKQNESGAFSEMVNQHVWAMIALDAAKQEYDSDGALQYLANFKCSDGGFNLEKCEKSDTDITGMALIALSNYKEEDNAVNLISGALEFLKSAQLDNAGFANGEYENSNTIATVISGLVAAGEDVCSDVWQKNAKTMTDRLMEYRLEDGSFVFCIEDAEANDLSTAQALIALDDICSGKSVWTQFEVPITVKVNVRIEGISSNILHEDVTVSGVKPKALDAIKKALDEKSVEYVIKDMSFGSYVSSVNGETESAFGGYDGWQYEVSGVSPNVGADSYELESGNEIVLYYGMYSPYTIFPSYSVMPETLREESDFKITVYSDWIQSETGDNGIEGVSVKVGDETYYTDENGVADIDSINKAGTYKVSISKEQEGSYPAIIRIPEFEIKVLKKRDTSSGSTRRTSTAVSAPVAAAPAEVTQPTVIEPLVEQYKDSGDISDWAADSAAKAKKSGIMEGDDEGSFKPKEYITRAEFTAIFVRLLKAENSDANQIYSDISQDKWYCNYVSSAKKLGLVNGYDDNTFRPDNTITREELAAIISRGIKLETSDLNFKDEDQLSTWAKDAAAQVNASGIMIGSDGFFSPKEKVTREMAVVISVRLYERINK